MPSFPKLTSTQLKWIALATMLIDHIGYMFLPGSAWYEPFRMIGRLSFPIFAWQLALSWDKTARPWRLAGLLLVFSLLSQAPYSLAFQNDKLNIFFLFFLAAPALGLRRAGRPYLAALAFLAAGFLSEMLYVSYGFYGIATIAAFSYARGSSLWMVFATIVMLFVAYQFGRLDFQWPAALATPLLLSYSGQRGARPMRWLFYAFYPLHLFALAWLKTALGYL